MTRSVTYDLTTDKAVWGKTSSYDGYYGEREAIGVGIVNDVKVSDYFGTYCYYYSFYATEMLDISVGSYDTSIATAEAYEINSSASADDVGNTAMKGVRINVTGLKAGETRGVVTPQFTVMSAEPSRNGYIFKGWADSADATDKTYKADDKITLTEEKLSKTIYAVWEKNDPIPPSLTVTKTPSEKSPVVGKDFIYTIKVENEKSEAVSVRSLIS